MKTIKKLKTSFLNLPYKNKLLITYLSIAIIPIMILGVFSFFQSRNLLSSSKVNDINFYFSKVSESLNSKIDGCQETLDVILSAPQMSPVFSYSEKSEDTAQKLEIAKTILEPYIHNVRLNNPHIRDITYYANNNCPPYHSIIRDISEFKKFDNTAHITDNSYFWYYSDKRIIVARSLVDSSDISAPIHIGYFCIQMNPADLLNTTASPEFFNYAVAMFSPDKQCIYSNIKKNSIDDELMLKAAYTDKKTVTHKAERYLVKNIVLDNGFVLCSYVKEKEVVDGIGSILFTTLAISLVCIIAVFLFNIVISGTLTKRISLLNGKIDQVRSGNMEVEVHSEYTDEIGNLTNNFSAMIEQINDLIQNVYESKLTQQKAELKALQSQIKPHFLYNTLQAVNWNAINRNDYETSEIVVNLSNFYRAVLNKGEDDISVKDELMIIKYYLKIEQKIHNGLFTVSYNIDPEVYAYSIPLLILQPLVENAIEHGIRKSRVTPGEITISAFIKKDILTFNITDTGAGVPEEKIGTIFTHQSGSYGLKNVNERIQLRFGKEYGISISSVSNPTTFTVTIPPVPFTPHENTEQ